MGVIVNVIEDQEPVTINVDEQENIEVQVSTPVGEAPVDDKEYVRKNADWVENSGGGSGTDPDAIHIDVAGEISGAIEKTTPVDADLVVIEDSATTPTAFGKKKLSWANIKATLNKISTGTTFDDSGTITIIETKEFDTVRQVTSTEHTLTFATSGNKRGAYYAVTYQFDVDCNLILVNNRETATSTGTRNPIPAGTYEFYFFTSHGEVGLVVQEATGENADFLLAEWDAAIDASVTTANGAVTIWADQTDNANSLNESTNTPAHSSANDNITFTGTASTTFDNLSAIITDFYFQQSDDFTVFIENLTFDSSGNGGAAGIVLGAMGAALPSVGWWLQINASGTILYFQMYDGATQNYASYTLASFLDDTPRNIILINESGTLKIYDATNTLVGTQGSTSLSSITYGSNVFRIGNLNNVNAQPFNGSIEKIKVWNKALSSDERDAELGL